MDLYIDRWNVAHAWKSFKNWVREHKPESAWLVVRKLKQRPVEDVSARTEAVVSKAIKNLLELCRECGIVNDDGVVVDPERLFNTDEKGLSQRSDSVARGVIARHQSSRASAVSSSPTWQHITVASFISLSGRRYPTGVVVSTSTVHQDFAQLWPKAFFYPNKGGSVTAAIFADMVQQCLARPARDFIATGKPLVLCLDSGGGSWLHLSAAFLKCCLQFGIKPFFTQLGQQKLCVHWTKWFILPWPDCGRSGSSCGATSVNLSRFSLH